MENCIENKHKKFNIKSKVFAAITMLIVGFVMMLCFACNTNVYAAESSTTDKTNKEIYNTDWTKANVKFFKEQLNFLGFTKTWNYIRITNKNGKFIDNLTYLSASYEIKKGSKTYNYKIDKAITSDSNGYFKLGNVFSEEGQLEKISEKQNKYNYSLEFKDDNGNAVKYEDCNYVWCWNYNITKIIYLYVWYIDPATGKQVASSFMPNGEHPLYNEDGTLKGIYDVDNNLMTNMTLNANGIPSEIIKNGDGTETTSPLVGWNEQEKGSCTNNNVLGILLNWPFGGSGSNSSNVNNWLETVVLILKLGILLLVVAAIIRFIKFIMSLFK